MLSLPYIIALCIGIIGAILLVIACIDSYHIKKKEKEKNTQPTPPQIHTATIHHAEAAFKAGEEEAKSLIQHAAKQAEETLTDAKMFKHEIVDELNASLSKVAAETLERFREQSKQFDQQYQTLFSHIESEYEKKSTDTLQSIEQVVQTELEDFKQILRKETISSQDVISQKIQEEFTTIQKELIIYREKKYHEVDILVQSIVKDITEQVLGKSFTSKDHEALIINSLEKAKTDGIFM